MSHLLANLPTLDCFVRQRFFYDQDPTVQGVKACYVVGFCGRYGHAPAFQVVTNEGAMWARVPLHMLCWQEDAPVIALEHLCWWDCFSDDFTVCAFDVLKGMACTLRDRVGTQRQGRYVLTIDWEGKWAELPDQHKQHHLVRLSTGQFAMYPNNAVIWRDASWTRELAQKPDWRVNSHEWSAER